MDTKNGGIVSDENGKNAKYATAERQREEHIDAILNSPSTGKIVVGGPGTGKTYLFERILKGKKNTLTLSFVNALVEDLSLELCGISEVKTLHGYARSVLKTAKGEDIKIFPNLEKVIQDDAIILLNDDVNFEYLFNNRDVDNMHIEFYRARKDYYRHYGFSDIIFEVVRYFEQNTHNIPTFKQVVVDEFQDFNKLEVSLIDKLGERSPILLAGDDDQALYGFKSASPKYIRQRYGEETSGYTPFELPYCSRCTRVIIEATNDIIKAATNNGLLSNRIKKSFLYLDHIDQDVVSDENPQIIYKQKEWNQIPTHIKIEIENIAKKVRDKFTVLIICPTNTQCKTVVNALVKIGFANTNYKGRKDGKEPDLLDGLKLLLEESNCNLGWRIVAKILLTDSDFKMLLKETNRDGAQGISDLINENLKRDVKKMLRTLRKVRDGKKTDDKELYDLLKKVDTDAYKRARDSLKDEIKSFQPPSLRATLAKSAVRKIPITITTIERSKGLDADYVFIAFFDDMYFLEDKSKVSDQDICKFIVSLTRAKRKVFLFSSNTRKKPTFLNWIDKSRIREIKPFLGSQK